MNKDWINQQQSEKYQPSAGISLIYSVDYLFSGYGAHHYFITALVAGYGCALALPVKVSKKVSLPS